MLSHNREFSLRIASLLLAMLSGLLSSPLIANTTLVIRGVEGELAENIRLLVSQPPATTSERQFRRYVDELPEQAITALSAFGYYAAEVSIRVQDIAPKPATGVGRTIEKIENTLKGTNGSQSQDANGGNSASAQADTNSAQNIGQLPEATTQILINVTPNEPVRIDNIELQINTQDAQSTDFDNVLFSVRKQLAKGAVFVSGEYESAKTSLVNTAQELGYFDFQFSITQVRVSRRAKTATITLMADAGERFTFGDILFQQRTFTETFMSRWLPFATGDPYQAELIGELTQNLQSSGYFASVRVRPLIDPRYEQTVPVIVDLSEQQDNQVAVGIGYSTDTKFRTTLNWSKPLLNSRGHSAQAGL